MSDFRELDPYLRKRYGITDSRRKSWMLWAVLILILGLAWTLWSGLTHSTPEIRANLITFKPIDDKSIEVRITVKFKSESKAHFCNLSARDYQANVVGEERIDFPAGTQERDLTTQIPTRLAAVSAEISNCQIR